MNNTKTVMLSELFLKFHENHPELFFKGSEYIDLKEKELQEFVQEEERTAFLNTLGQSSWEYYWGGMIDGFKMGIWLFEELQSSKNGDFMKELLLKVDK